ncbi:AMP-binding protein [Tsukamurella sp. NPDC003166]|uniref:AMP-binding protein n=1 Tax=Tsukamurella sp. NPDC003166 TaxID=3154444 RepID=UPI0033BF4C4E
MGIRDAIGDAFAAVGRVEAFAKNASEYARFGGLEVDEKRSPFSVEYTGPALSLRRYFPDELPGTDQPSLLLVPPLMMMSDVYDVAPKSSSVKAVHDLGVDVWVADFGRPEEVEGGLDRGIADHVLAVSDAVEQIRAATGRDVVLGGYSQGGMFCYQAAAYRRGDGIDSVIAFGSPVEFASMPIPMSVETFTSIARGLLDTGLVDKVALPSWFNRSATRMLEPIRSVQFELAYIKQLHDRDKLEPGEQQRKFLAHDGWTSYSGPALRDLLENVIVTNRMLEGGLVIGDRPVSLADLEMPLLIVIGDIDKEGHPRSVRPILQAAPRADIHQLDLHTGHFGIVAGGGARRNTWPRVADWIAWRAGRAELPEQIVPAREQTTIAGWRPGEIASRVTATTDIGVEVVKTVWGAATEAGDLAFSLLRDRVSGVPLINRIEALRPDTAVSLGLLLDEAANRAPSAPALLFEDRVLRREEVKHRIDSIVKGLITLGVRPGDRVGVLMDTRPTALCTVAAISRLGAAAVLLRPDGDLHQELQLSEASVVIADPQRIPQVRPADEVVWAVLGSEGEGGRVVPAYATDLERVDPARVADPAWYHANPTRATDLAFVLFTGRGAGVRVLEITNRRWALSALGTASAAGLGPGDTVYSVTPLHHSSALLMAVASAVASGARLALAAAPDVDVFWQEVRRYGATHVSYNWSSLREIAVAPTRPEEAHSSIRMFMGSGMPPNLWRRVAERFAPARVLEFYGSAQAEAILANVSGERVGSVGRPVPGTARVKVAAFDPATGRLAFEQDGFARECDPGEPGLLLARCEASPGTPNVLRSVFAAEDAWQSTGDVFVKSADGDYWYVESVDRLLAAPRGYIAPRRIAQTLQRISNVDLATVFLTEGPTGSTAVVAAVTVQPGSDLSGWALSSALRRLPADQRPDFVRVVADVPVAQWSRPVWDDVIARGLGSAADGPLFARGEDGETYTAAEV